MIKVALFYSAGESCERSRSEYVSEHAHGICNKATSTGANLFAAVDESMQ